MRRNQFAHGVDGLPDRALEGLPWGPHGADVAGDYSFGKSHSVSALHARLSYVFWRIKLKFNIRYENLGRSTLVSNTVNGDRGAHRRRRFGARLILLRPCLKLYQKRLARFFRHAREFGAQFGRAPSA